ncbi:MAG: MmcQ/YjbR family DNA-binding protein [Helicobacteraceae bacterium]|jgi:predicted DNA-binding protein (MmcQ/YjbR family)|nr:MmcQ/YjbR family DNA-binding protein [Helicobacteraceae bacterium]
MDFATIEKLSLRRRGAIKEYKPSWDSTLFRIGGKIFVLVMHDEKTPMMNFKNDPFVNLHLREQRADITAAYHMNKKRWNTLYYKESDIDENYLDLLIRESYEIVYDSLTKKLKAAINGGR